MIFLLHFRIVQDLKNILWKSHKDPSIIYGEYDSKRNSLNRI